MWSESKLALRLNRHAALSRVPSHHAPNRPRGQSARAIVTTARTADLPVRLRASAYYDDKTVRRRFMANAEYYRAEAKRCRELAA
jgi:hypothetical protein